MDRQFLEFMGNFMLSAAKGQKQVEDMAKWMGFGFAGFEELSSFFRKIYGLEEPKRESADYRNLWTGAMEHFSASFKEYLALFGAQPREDYLALVKKVEELKERVESQDETIRHLRILLAEAKKEEYQSVAGHFEDLVQKQAEQFQNLMDSLGHVFKQGDSPHDG